MYVKNLKIIDTKLLEKLIEVSVADMRKIYNVPE